MGGCIRGPSYFSPFFASEMRKDSSGKPLKKIGKLSLASMKSTSQPALLMQYSCDGCVCECELVRDIQVYQGVVLKLSYRLSRSGLIQLTQQVS
jgi:hypothetical protein